LVQNLSELTNRTLAMRMAAKQYLGQLSSFQPKSETISAHLEWVKIFFGINGIEEDQQKVSVFLNAVGSWMYVLLRDLLAPVKPADKAFADIQKVQTDHYEPKPLVIAERFYFHQRQMNQYVAEL